MSQDKLEIQFVLLSMLRIDYKCISQLMLIWLAACVVQMRKERNKGLVLVVYIYAVLFVIIFIYLAATPQAVGIWLMIIRVRIRSLSHLESFPHCLWSNKPFIHFQHALPNQILVRSFKLAYSPKVKNYFLFFASSYFSSNSAERLHKEEVLWM